MTMMDMQLLVVTGMVVVMVAVLGYSFHRDQALHDRRLVRIPVRVRDQRGRVRVQEEEPNEASPVVYYLAFTLAAYLIAMFILAV